jgi:2-methylisocitrate lyase-like PEP mutase family enzyme
MSQVSRDSPAEMSRAEPASPRRLNAAPGCSRAHRLRELILSPKLLVMPGAYDPLTARLVEEAGFEAVQCSGYGISVAHLGLPDYGFLGMREMVDRTARLVEAVRIPVMADGDTGFGNAVNAYHAVRAFERVGAAGVNIEDQVAPKRCGHLDGRRILPLDEAVAKIRACAEARVDPDFVINARTDALAIDGIEEAIRRGNAYLGAGATMVFVDGLDSVAAARRLVQEIRGPVAINAVEGGRTPHGFDFAQMEALGIARVSLPGTTLFAAVRAIREVLLEVRSRGGIEGYEDRIANFSEVQELLGMRDLLTLEERLLGHLR